MRGLHECVCVCVCVLFCARMHARKPARGLHACFVVCVSADCMLAIRFVLKKSACIISMRFVCVCGLHAYYAHACIITCEFASSEDRQSHGREIFAKEV